MQVVVNADDMGLHPGVLRAAEACAAAGIVTSASLLANGPCVKDARGLRGIGLAAHLNILRGQPLSPHREVRSLLGDDGLFLRRYTRLFARYAVGSMNLAEVEREWCRQIERLLDLGFALTHLDSEKHIHCWPRLMPVACRLAARFQLHWVRRVSEPPSLGPTVGATLRGALLHHWSRKHESPTHVNWPDAVWGVGDSGPGLTVSRFARWFTSNAEKQVVEIVCHPGLPVSGDAPVCETFGRLRAARHWDIESHALLRQPWRAWFAEHGVQLTHYGRLPFRERGDSRPAREGVPASCN